MATLLRTGNEAVDRALGNVVSAVNALERVPMNQGVLLEGLTIGTGDTRIAHGLDRVVRGYFVVRASVAADVYDGTASTNPTAYLNLRASSAGTFSILLF
jgi:hypothetical protein